MNSPAPSLKSRRALLAECQSLYDEHRFLDAYEASVEYWTASTPIDELSAEEMIFASRLASRLGGMRLSRHLCRKARERYPGSPIVRYFTRHIHGVRHLLLDELLEFEKDPELGGDDPELRASWQAAHAYIFATLRDFTRARELLKRAHELSPGSAWVFSQEADVFGMADQWRDSLCCAEHGCEADPRSPWPVLSLADALLHLGEIQEAVPRLLLASRDSQFFHVVQAACWYHCALAETLEGNERHQTLLTARKLAERIEAMTPLSDREFKSSLARMWLDLAEMGDDHAAMEHWAQKARSPFHRKILANLKANPDGKRIRLPYRRTIQKHAECVPASISSALSATGVYVPVEELAGEVTFGGTPGWAAADWLRQKGYHVRFFAATPGITGRLIEAGIGFTISWDDDESGHTVAIVGIDHAAGTAIVHDPSSFRSAEYLISGFTADYGPLGLTAMAAVPITLAVVLDAIVPPESEVVEAAEAQQKALAMYGSTAARPIVKDLETRLPDHPGTSYLRAIQSLADGRVGRALEGFRKLLEAYPQSPTVRVRLMTACRSLGDTALLRETLRSVVETGKMPGVDSLNDWNAPHPRYFYNYADLLRFSAETWAKSESLLCSLMRNNWRSAGAWHVLADLRWDQRDHKSALLAYRIASTLAEHNEHYAAAYVNVLCRIGRTHEGMEWLRSRAERLGNSIHGVSTWITYVGMLEDWGNPDLALTVCRDVLGRFGTSPSLLAFAVPFFARMGQWEEAEHWFEALRRTGAEAYFEEAAVYFFQMRGMTDKALEHAEAWISEVPLSIPARSKLLWLVASVHGKTHALDRAAQWMRERPENEHFEELFCQHVEFPIWRKIRVLRGRVKRNRDDAWAWRELAMAAIWEFEHSDEVHRGRLQPRIQSYLAEADRLTSGDTATLHAQGLWHEALGNWKEALRCYLESIRFDPGGSWGYHRAFEISARFLATEQRAMWAEVEPIWLSNPGHLPDCLQIIRHLNELFGPRETEQIIANWRELRPDDPNVVEAMANLLLDFGHGRSDSIRALELLRPAVKRYPYHSGLRFSLARAWQATSDDAAAARELQELVLRRPDNLSALIQLALIREREGRTHDALRILKGASEQEPQNPDPLDILAQLLIANGRYDEAIAVVEDGLRRLPHSVRMYDRATALFAKCGRREKAVETARQAIQAYPSRAYLWLLLGRTLREHAEFAAPGEIEQCLRRSLQLNHGLYESADWLAVILTEQRRYKEAFRILSDVELRLANPSPVQGRMAWIRRQTGEKRAAITDLSDVLQRFPGYTWGWNTLLNWLEEDEEWELSKDPLGPVPPQLIAEVGFRMNRLLLLEKAGAEAASLNPEWLHLLEDFPEDVTLHLRRYDALRDAKRWEEASATLERVAQVAGQDQYFMARLADVRCHEERFDEALECGLKVCFALVEPSVWPVNRVWEVFATAGKDRQLAKKFRAKLEEGLEPTNRALSRFVEYLLDQEPPDVLPQFLRQTRLNHVTRELIALMKLVQRCRWRAKFHTTGLYSILNSRQYSGLVVRFWKEACYQGLDEDSGAWAEAGSAMVDRGKRRMARRLFQGWRDRRGVQMWSLANYLQILSHSNGEDLEEIVATCRDALANLPHDHCARYLACLQAEACALLGRNDDLIAVWDDRRGYFDEDTLNEHEYFNPSEEHLVYDIPDIIKALQSGDHRAHRKLLWRLRFKRLNEFRWILRILARILILAWVIFMAVGIFGL